MILFLYLLTTFCEKISTKSYNKTFLNKHIHYTYEVDSRYEIYISTTKIIRTVATLINVAINNNNREFQSYNIMYL